MAIVCDIGRRLLNDPACERRGALLAAMGAIEAYERKLCLRLIDGLQQLPRVRLLGITEPARFAERVPTLALVVEGMPSAEVARRLGERGIYCWHGHYYAIAICEALGQHHHGMLRLGLMHTNTPAEVERTIETLREVIA